MLLELCCRPARSSREHETHRETLKIHGFYLIRPAQPTSLPELIAHSRIPSVNGAADDLFLPKGWSCMTEEVVGCVSEAHPMGACFCGWAGFAFGGRRKRRRRSGGGGTGCGTIPSPPPPLHPPCASALVASGRVGLCLSAGELQQNWRGLILVGVFF